MSDHIPFFPENLDDYAPWVATHGLLAPYGKCQCGCGGDVKISAQSSTADFWRKGHPRRFIKFHGKKLHKLRKVSDVEVFWQRVQKTDTCWLWTWSKHRFGYGWFHAAGKKVTTHRYSYELHNGPIPEGLCVLHKCDNPACVNPAHLFLGTQADNNADKVRKGRQHRGEKTGGAKLTEGSVRQIRELYASGLTQHEIAIRFGVARESVGGVVRGERWAHVGGPLRAPRGSGVKGVSWHSQHNRWRARIMVNYKEISLGLFDTVEEAARAREAANQNLLAGEQPISGLVDNEAKKS